MRNESLQQDDRVVGSGAQWRGRDAECASDRLRTRDRMLSSLFSF